MRTTRTTANDIEIDALSAISGDTKLYVDDDNPEERKTLAIKLAELIKEGVSVFLVQGKEARRITAYDDKTNEWIVVATSTAAPPRERVSARRTRATAVPAVAGG